jgi:hypothetical protein
MISVILEKEVKREMEKRDEKVRTLGFVEDMLGLVSVLSAENIWVNVPNHD